jgi:ADP-L-glycero-D-manno-heptose 6-epimerase
MKVLITGHKGFIGQNYCNVAHNLGWQVSTFDILDNPNTRPKDLDFDGCDWVIHLGALSSTTETDVQRVMDLNVAWSIELFEECVRHGANLQWASSASVYGHRREKMKVDDKCSPLNLYAKSKYLLEQYMSKSWSTDIITQGFRYFNVYGPHEGHKGNQASPYYQFAKQAKETGVIKVFEGSENFYRDFIHVDALIKKQIESMTEDDTGIYNIGTGHPRSFMEVARDIALLYDVKIETITFPEYLKPHYQRYTCAG